MPSKGLCVMCRRPGRLLNDDKVCIGCSPETFIRECCDGHKAHRDAKHCEWFVANYRVKDIMALRNIATEATPGPWEVNSYDGSDFVEVYSAAGVEPDSRAIGVCATRAELYGGGRFGQDPEQATKDARFIASARVAVPFLIACLGEAETRIGHLCGQIRQLSDRLGDSEPIDEATHIGRVGGRIGTPALPDHKPLWYPIAQALANRYRELGRKVPDDAADRLYEFMRDPIVTPDTDPWVVGVMRAGAETIAACSVAQRGVECQDDEKD